MYKIGQCLDTLYHYQHTAGCTIVKHLLQRQRKLTSTTRIAENARFTRSYAGPVLDAISIMSPSLLQQDSPSAFSVQKGMWLCSERQERYSQTPSYEMPSFR